MKSLSLSSPRVQKRIYGRCNANKSGESRAAARASCSNLPIKDWCKRSPFLSPWQFNLFVFIIWQGKSERSDWFFLGRDFYHTDRFHGNGPSRVFCGFEKPANLSAV